MRIAFFERTRGACDFYRVVQPLTWVGVEMKEKHQVKGISTTQFRAGMASDEPAILRNLIEADLIVVPRMWGKGCFQQLREINPRAKIVLEYDDNLFDVSPLSPHYAEHGVEEIEIMHQGEKLKLWEDGKTGFDLKANRQAYNETLALLPQADLITTTTEILAKKFREWNPNVVVLPNCVDLRTWQKLPLQPRAGLRMGWFGGHSHYEDWLILKEILPPLMAEFRDLKLVLMGARFDGTLKGIPAERIEFHPWVDTEAYPYKAAILDLDLALIPLKDTPFNQCKSAIKWIEMGALKVPAVTSFVPPYTEVATDANGIWVEANNAEAWRAGIRMLLRDPLLRSKTGFEAFQTVKNQFDIAKNYQRWAAAYEEVLLAKSLAHA